MNFIPASQFCHRSCFQNADSPFLLRTCYAQATHSHYRMFQIKVLFALATCLTTIVIRLNDSRYANYQNYEYSCTATARWDGCATAAQHLVKK